MGRCLLLCAWGWGIDHHERKKLQIPVGIPGGGMVTSQIEPRIILTCNSSLSLYYICYRVEKTF